jgi:ribosomal protein S21
VSVRRDNPLVTAPLGVPALDVEWALKILKEKIGRCDVLNELRRREFYQSKGEARRAKRRRAAARRRRLARKEARVAAKYQNQRPDEAERRDVTWSIDK